MIDTVTTWMLSIMPIPAWIMWTGIWAMIVTALFMDKDDWPDA